MLRDESLSGSRFASVVVETWPDLQHVRNGRIEI